MKTIPITAFIAWCCLTSAAWANPAPCAMGSLADYMAPGFSCTIGDKVFSSFTYSQSPPPDTQVDPGNIQVSPVNAPNNPGLNFQDAGN